MMNTRVSQIAVITVCLSIVLCSKLDTITIEESSTTTIQAGTLLEQLIGGIGFAGFLNMDITSNTTLANQGVTKDQIDNIFIKSLVLNITDPPQGQDFTFIDSIEFHIQAPDLPKKLIASGGSFPPGSAKVSLALSEIDIGPYAVADYMDITTEATGRRPDRTTTVRADIVLDVDVNVSGVICGTR